MNDYADLFSRHERVALQVSGGKDSLVILYLLRNWWDKLSVYWLNSGDPFPETVDLMAKIKAEVPHFVEIAGQQKQIIESDGWPSDVVPSKWTRFGQYVFGPRKFAVQGRLDCCWRSLMLPMHEAMVRDGITCVIRGKRSEEADKSPSRSGDVIDGIEFFYPLWDWTEQDVIGYLRDNHIELPESYAYAKHSLDCMSCTAWWGEGLESYLEAKYPEHYAEHLRRIWLIKSAVSGELNKLEV